MELLNLIKNNQITSYENLKNILENEPYNLKIKEDTDLPNLFLIHNSENSNKELIIVRECNGIILEKDTLKIVCYSFDKCSDELTLPSNLDNNDLYIENSIEGTLVRYFYYDNKWILSTKKCIDANKARWLSIKNFYQLFQECLDSNSIYLLDKLNSNYCYSFIITHPENNIVVNYINKNIYHISTRDMTTLKEIETHINVSKLTRTFIPTKNIESIIETSMNVKQLNHEGLIFIDANYNRWKLKNIYFNRAREIWGNTNNRLYRYIELRKDINLLHEYLTYFPNDRNLFVSYEYRIKQLCSHISAIYSAKYILKSDDAKIPFYLVKILYKLHGDYIKDRIKVNMSKIGIGLLNTDTKLLCFMINHYEKATALKESNMNIENENNMIEEIVNVEMEVE